MTATIFLITFYAKMCAPICFQFYLIKYDLWMKPTIINLRKEMIDIFRCFISSFAWFVIPIFQFLFIST